MSGLAEPPKDPKTALQEWVLARGLQLPTYALVSREGPPHDPVFVIGVSAAGQRGHAAPPAASASPSGWRRPTCWPGSAHERRSRRPALRLRGHRRRAERRQIHPAEPADRRQAVDRQPEGADHAVPRARHPDARRRRKSCWWTRPASSARAAGSTAPWCTPPGPARRMPTWCCCWSMPAPASTEDVRAIAERLRERGGRAWLVLNKVDLIDAAAPAAADRRADRARRLRAHLHGQRRHRRRAGRAAGRSGRGHAGRPASLSRRRPDRPARPAARRRDRARADLPADPRGSALRHHGRNRELAGAPATARCASRPPSTSPAPARRRS